MDGLIVTGTVKSALKRWRREGRHALLVSLSASAWRQGKSLRHLVALPSILRELRAVTQQSWDDQQLVAHALHGFRRVFAPIQAASEIEALIARVRALQPRTLLEIGTANGGTLFLLCQVAAPDARILSVDLPGGWFGGGYAAWKKPVYRKFARPGQSLGLVRADSHAEATVQRVRDWLDGQALDFLFLDGDHTYAGVKQDYERYSSLVRRDGLVALHDIVPNRFDPDCQVHRFWQELKQRSATQELVQDWNQAGKGIGVVHMSD